MLSTHHLQPTARVHKRAALALLALLLSGCSLVGLHNTPEPAYRVLEAQEPFEIRQYESMLIATTRVDKNFDDAGSEAFRRLFGYISGANREQLEMAMTVPVIASDSQADAGVEIAMTAPVSGQRVDQGWRFSFVLPEGFDLQNAPLPTDTRVSLEQVPARQVAVLRYSGFWGLDAFDEHAEQLSQWLSQQQLQPTSAPRVASYDPPWALPFLRRNEVMVDIGS